MARMNPISSLIRSCLLTTFLAASACASTPPAQEPATTPEAAPPSLPADGIDYACSADADCEVKNLGSCCGYNPRCMNVRSQPVPEQCAEGMMGTCGFPEITHCACSESRCVSMQGDRALN
jgi:hypothetical protein